MNPHIASICEEVRAEVERAERKHNPIDNAHEGYAVLLEELDELWEEVKKGGSVPRDEEEMRKEAIQTAAMAVRFVRDVCDRRGYRRGGET